MKIKSILFFLTLTVIFIMGTNCSLPSTMTTSSSLSTTSTTLPKPTYASSVVGTDTVLVIPDFVSLIAKVKPSVVAITTEVSVKVFGRVYLLSSVRVLNIPLDPGSSPMMKDILSLTTTLSTEQIVLL